MTGGTVAPGFEGDRDAFERCFTELGETGAAFSAFVDGRVVADLWGGDGFHRDALVHAYSVTKPMAAFCITRDTAAGRPRPRGGDGRRGARRARLNR